jgi:hypothetical protein
MIGRGGWTRVGRIPGGKELTGVRYLLPDQAYPPWGRDLISARVHEIDDLASFAQPTHSLKLTIGDVELRPSRHRNNIDIQRFAVPDTHVYGPSFGLVERNDLSESSPHQSISFGFCQSSIKLHDRGALGNFIRSDGSFRNW